MTPPVLWHFRFSHYNEKARWALGASSLRRRLLRGDSRRDEEGVT